MQKKKKSQTTNIDKSMVLLPKGLFASNNSREHLLEEFKRGTLFNSTFRRNEHNPLKQKVNTEQDENWINSININSEDQEEFGHFFPTSFTNKKLKPIRNISLRVVQKRESMKRIIERKCNKNTCFERKLKTVGAWNKENKNSIDKSIHKLANLMGNSEQSYVQNDFQRLGRRSFKVDGSFDKTFLSINQDLSMTEENPFRTLTQFNRMDKLELIKSRPSLLTKTFRLRKQRSQGDNVPGFLLNSLIVQNSSYSKVKLKK